MNLRLLRENLRRNGFSKREWQRLDWILMKIFYIFDYTYPVLNYLYLPLFEPIRQSFCKLLIHLDFIWHNFYILFGIIWLVLHFGFWLANVLLIRFHLFLLCSDLYRLSVPLDFFYLLTFHYYFFFHSHLHHLEFLSALLPFLFNSISFISDWQYIVKSLQLVGVNIIIIKIRNEESLPLFIIRLRIWTLLLS